MEERVELFTSPQEKILPTYGHKSTHKKIKLQGYLRVDGEMTQWFRVLPSLPEDSGSIPSTNSVDNFYNSHSRGMDAIFCFEQKPGIHMILTYKQTYKQAKKNLCEFLKNI